MSVARLWPLAFLVIEPLIILLYMIKQKAKDVKVPSTYLWREAYKSVQSDTPWEKLKHNIIMYLQLLAVLSLIIACLSPILKNGKSSADRVIVGLDTTASMLMEDENGESRIERAKEDLVTYAESLKKGTLVTVVAMGDTPSIIYEGRADGLLLKSALSGVKANVTDGSAYDGLDYVRSLLKENGGDCYIYTDTLFDTGSSDISLINVGDDADNYSVDYMQGIYTEVGLTEYVGVTNHSKEKMLQADLALYIEGELYEVKDVALEPGKSTAYGFLLGNEGTEKVLKATLHVKDALNNDNEREDFVYEEGLGKVCLVTERNTFLENAILAAGKYELVLAGSPAMLPEGCEIYIFDGIFPEVFPEKPYIVFEKGETDAKVRLLSSDTEYSLSGVKTYELTENDTPLMVTAEGEACAFIRKEGSVSKVYVGFDLHMGDFVLDAQFPIFLYNVLSDLQRSAKEETVLYSFPAAESGVMSGYSVGSAKDSTGKVIKAGEKTARNITVYFIIAVIVILIAITVIYIVRKESRIIPVLRSIAVIFLVLAALDINISYHARGNCVIYLIDVSESNLDNIKQAEKFVKDAIATKASGDMQAVLVFGKDVKTESFLAKDSIFSEIMARPVSSATNLETAIDAGLKLIRPGSAGKIVLLTDGAENEGSILKTVSEIRAKNAEVLVVLFDREETSENYISGVRIPSDVEIGSEFTVSVTVESNVDTDGILTLYEESLGGSARVKAEKKVHIHEGSNEFIFTDIREKSGLIFYKAVLESGNDTKSVNNTYSAYTKAEAGEKYLLVTNETEGLFFDALMAAGRKVNRITPADLPENVLDYSEYAGVILDNVPATALSKESLNALSYFVKDMGGGLITTGGRNAYAIGGMKDTVLEEMLPVSSDLQNKEEIPTLSMVYVIDKSGSMCGIEGDSTSYSKLDMAKTAAAEGLNNLRPTDKVEVIAFDDTYTKMYPLTSAKDIGPAKEAIGKIHDGGGTSIFPAVFAAADDLKDDDSAIKHIILLTDGQDYYDNYNRLFAILEDRGITLSCVAVGEDADKELLKRLAEGGSGRYYESTKITDLPSIFAQEVIIAMEEYLVNREFTPVVTGANTELLRGVAEEGLYPLYGYVAAGLKNNAVSILESDDGDPILATSRYGLGKVVSYMSDTSYKWSAAYSGTSELLNLYKNMTDYVKADIETEGSINTLISGNKAQITYTFPEVKEGQEVEFTLIENGGDSVDLKANLVGAGVYSAEADIDPDKTYAVIAKRSVNGEPEGTLLTGIAGNYSLEYTFAEKSGFNNFLEGDYARVITDPLEVYKAAEGKQKQTVSLRLLFLILALILICIDIAFRRFGIEISIISMIRKHMTKAKEKAKVRRIDEAGLTQGKEKEESKSDKAPAPKRKKEQAPENTGLDTEFLFKKQNERKR